MKPHPIVLNVVLWRDADSLSGWTVTDYLTVLMAYTPNV